MKTFEFRQSRDGVIEVLEISTYPDGDLLMQMSDRNIERKWTRSRIDLPAADARRLRDWLCERYPHEEDK